MNTSINANSLTATAGLLLIIAFFSNSAYAQKGQGDQTGIAREIIKPPVETFIGELDHIKTGPCEQTTGHAYVGTHLFLKTGDADQLLNIHLGAAYAVESYVKVLEIGQIVEVQGFRTGQMEAGHYIAKEITVNGHTLQLRDEDLRPFWAGNRDPQRRSRADMRRRGRGRF